jgi:hypothetical protein
MPNGIDRVVNPIGWSIRSNSGNRLITQLLTCWRRQLRTVGIHASEKVVLSHVYILKKNHRRDCQHPHFPEDLSRILVWHHA